MPAEADKWICRGCEIGAPPALTRITAGDTNVHLHNIEACQVLFKSLSAVLATGDFGAPPTTANPRLQKSMPTRVTVGATEGGPEIEGDGALPIIQAMDDLSLNAVVGRNFKDPVVYTLNVDRFKAMSASDPTQPSGKRS